MATAEKRCQAPGCAESRYRSPAGYTKGWCGRHLAARRRPVGIGARRWDYIRGDFLERQGR
jgi:hypothetical protein